MEGQPPSSNAGVEVAVGCTLTLVFHVVASIVMLGLLFSVDAPIIETITTGFLLGLGVTQVVYMGPAIYVAYQRGRPNIGKGLLIGAAITLALTAACWAIINPFTLGPFH
jgi:hypothetical protein